jgi:hypothetical protein
MAMTDEEAVDLTAKTRAELNDIAGELGLPDAAEFPNKADLITAIEAKQAETAPEEAEEEPAKGAQYRVLKAFTLNSGQTVMPGDTVTPEKDWPERRPGQLVKQGYLNALED